MLEENSYGKPGKQVPKSKFRFDHLRGSVSSDPLSSLVIHIMTPGVIQIPGDVSVGEAARLMEKEHVPCILIKDSDAQVGIVTHADIVYKVVAQGLNPDDIQTRRVMTSPVRSIEFDEPTEAATSLMTATGVSLLVVTRDRHPIGILTPRDLVSLSEERDSHIPASVRVYEDTPDGVRHPALITQLNHLGAFVETDAQMRAGTRVTLEFYLPAAKRAVAVEATVLGLADLREGAGGPDGRGHGVVAVRFTDVRDTDQSEISEWIIKQRAQASGDS